MNLLDGLNEAGKYFLISERRFECPCCLDLFILRHNRLRDAGLLLEIDYKGEVAKHIHFCRLQAKAKSLIKGEPTC